MRMKKMERTDLVRQDEKEGRDLSMPLDMIQQSAFPVEGRDRMMDVLLDGMKCCPSWSIPLLKMDRKNRTRKMVSKTCLTHSSRGREKFLPKEIW